MLVGFLAAGSDGKASAPLARFCEDWVRLGVGLGRAELLAELEGFGASQLGVGAGAAGLLRVGRAGNAGPPVDAGGRLEPVHVGWLPTAPLELWAVELLSLRTREEPTPAPSMPTEDVALPPEGPGNEG